MLPVWLSGAALSRLGRAALPGSALTSVPQPGGRRKGFAVFSLRFGTVAPGVDLITRSA